MRLLNKIYLLATGFSLMACSDFLETPPLANPSDATFWTSYDRAEMWVNNAYKDLPGWEDYSFEPMSDNSAGPGRGNCNLVANGTFESTTNITSFKWGYSYIRHCLELLDKLELIPNLTAEKKKWISRSGSFYNSFSVF